MTERPKLILHIGTHKTATSTLQAIMELERAALIGQGFYYPQTNRPPHPNLPKHSSLYAALMAGPGVLRVERDCLMREFEASGCATMVLSEEGLSSPGMLRKNAIPGIAILAPDFDIRIISVLRRQDSFVESLWNQYTREKTTNKHITDFIKAPNPLQYMTYLDTLGEWGKYGEITAIGYETAIETGIVEAFSAATGMILPKEDSRENVSPSMGCAALMAAMNKLDIPYDWRRIEAALGTDARRYALGSRLRRKLLDQFADHNARLREKFGVVFPDKMPSEPEEPIPEPGIAEVKRIVALMHEAGDRKSIIPSRLRTGRKAAEGGGKKAARQAVVAAAADQPMAAPARTGGKKPKLLLHIGTHNTAASTLQYLMSNNRTKMAESGFLYARTDREPMPKANKHAFFFSLMKQGGAPFRELRTQLLKELSASGCHTMVMSEEGLAGPSLSAKFANLGIMAEHFDIEAVCLLRRQDSFAESFWNFLSRLGEETRQIAEYVQAAHIRRYMNYVAMLDRWAAFAKVTALGYEAACEKGLIETFSETMGFGLPSESTKRNVSPSMKVASTLVALNREGKSFRWQKIVPLLARDTRKTALGSRLRKELLADFAEHNETLAKRYGVIFPSILPEEPEDPIEAPTDAEIAALIAAGVVGEERAVANRALPAAANKRSKIAPDA